MNEASSQRGLFKRDMFAKKNKYSSGLLAHGEEPVNPLRRNLVVVAALAIIAALVFLPSHQIAKVQTVKFPFEVPTHVREGAVMTFPARETDQVVRVGATAPARLEKQNMYMMGFGLQEAVPETLQVTLWSLSRPAHLGWFKRQFVSSPIEYSEQIITLDRATTHLPVAVHLPPVVSKQLRRIASDDIVREGETSAALLNRKDGSTRLDCWLSPLPLANTATATEFGGTRVFDNGQKSVHESLDLKANIGTAVKAAGAGEVVAADTMAIPGRTITIYHGDGLYTRYSHLHEFQTHVGEKVAAGQMIGFSGNSGRIESPYLSFEVIWHGKNLNPAEVLKVSQQACNDPKTPLAQKTDRADRSPASKIYRWMNHQGH